MITDLLLSALILTAALRGSVVGSRRGVTELMGLSSGIAVAAMIAIFDAAPLLRALPATAGLVAGISLARVEDDLSPLSPTDRTAGLLAGVAIGLLLSAGLLVVNLDASLRPFDEGSVLLRLLAAPLGR